jgi:hypothetical protein
MTARLCEVEGCNRPHQSRGWCNTHYRRWQRHGAPNAEAPIEAKITGEEPSYWSAHRRVNAELGPATEHACTECGAPAVCWSYDRSDPDERVGPGRGYRYSLDPYRYRPRCRSCHRRATSAVVDADRAARLYLAGASVPGIASLLGFSASAVYRALRAHGVPIRPRTRHRA